MFTIHYEPKTMRLSQFFIGLLHIITNRLVSHFLKQKLLGCKVINNCMFATSRALIKFGHCIF